MVAAVTNHVSPITVKRSQRIRDLLKSRGATSTGDIARAANVPPTSAYELLSDMDDVDSCIDGGSRTWWLKERSSQKPVGGSDTLQVHIASHVDEDGAEDAGETSGGAK